MQRFVLTAFLTTTLTIGPALAGPLSLNPDTSGRPAARNAVQPSAGQYRVQQSAGAAYAAQVPDETQAPAPPVRQVAAQGYGGGFLEFLFGGGGSRYEQRPVYYGGQQVPADAGPGMVESPYAPGRAVVDPRYMRQEVSYSGKEGAGTIIINTNERFLYLVQGNGRAVRYGIGVGRPGFTWSGTHHITNKREWPDWTPPDEMLKRRPDLPRHMAGGPDNPLGARAMYLGSTLYRIHGSNEPWTIGTQVSSGCIRMRNEDVVDLYGRVKIGTKVVVI
jgi:lipoprotein-anchoring transpeptidase ErfK/SrfK